ncbi:MAG: hypothetical protein AAF570_10160 [Bacteroidota bacterium]
MPENSISISFNLNSVENVRETLTENLGQLFRDDPTPIPGGEILIMDMKQDYQYTADFLRENGDDPEKEFVDSMGWDLRDHPIFLDITNHSRFEFKAYFESLGKVIAEVVTSKEKCRAILKINDEEWTWFENGKEAKVQNTA